MNGNYGLYALGTYCLFVGVDSYLRLDYYDIFFFEFCLLRDACVVMQFWVDGSG